MYLRRRYSNSMYTCRQPDQATQSVAACGVCYLLPVLVTRPLGTPHLRHWLKSVILLCTLTGPNCIKIFLWIFCTSRTATYVFKTLHSWICIFTLLCSCADSSNLQRVKPPKPISSDFLKKWGLTPKPKPIISFRVGFLKLGFEPCRQVAALFYYRGLRALVASHSQCTVMSFLHLQTSRWRLSMADRKPGGLTVVAKIGEIHFAVTGTSNYNSY